MSFDKDKACSGLAWAAVGVLLFFVSVAAVVRLVDVRQDYAAHIMIAAKITLKSLAHPIAFLRENCYPVWHILTRFTMKFGFGGRSAAAVVTGASILGVWIYAAHYFSRKYQEWNKDVARAASVVLILVAPIWLPFFNHNLIIGQGSPNMLHNPTHLMVRLVAFPCFMLCVAIMDGIGKKSATRLGAGRVIAFSLFVFLTALSKPSFVQMLFPALFFLALFKMVKYGKAAIWPVATVVLSLVPSLLLMCLQAWVSFYSAKDSGSGVAIAFLKLYSRHSPNVFVSVMLGICFPLIMLLWSIRARKVSTAEVLAWIMYGVGWTQGALLIETGYRMLHGNFCWALNLSLFFIWFTALDRFISLAVELSNSPGDRERKWWFWCAVAVLLLHLVSGFCYLWRVLVMGIWA